MLVLFSDGDSRQVDVDARDRHKNRSDGSKNVLFLVDKGESSRGKESEFFIYFCSFGHIYGSPNKINLEKFVKVDKRIK